MWFTHTGLNLSSHICFFETDKFHKAKQTAFSMPVHFHIKQTTIFRAHHGYLPLTTTIFTLRELNSSRFVAQLLNSEQLWRHEKYLIDHQNPSAIEILCLPSTNMFPQHHIVTGGARCIFLKVRLVEGWHTRVEQACCCLPWICCLPLNSCC